MSENEQLFISIPEWWNPDSINIISKSSMQAGPRYTAGQARKFAQKLLEKADELDSKSSRSHAGDH